MSQTLKEKVIQKAIEPVRNVTRQIALRFDKEFMQVYKMNKQLMSIVQTEIVKGQSPAPIADFVNAERADIMLPRLPYNPFYFYRMVWSSPVLRTIHIKTKQEAFRETKKDGWDWIPKFKLKCKHCTAEFQEHIEQCPFCRNTDFREPDVTQQKLLDKWDLKANEAEQSFIDILEELEDDLNTVDDCYLVFSKEYLTDSQHVHGRVREIMRGDPCRFRIVADPSGRRGGYLWVCVHHRDSPKNQPGYCSKPNCNLPLQAVHYVETEAGGKKTINFYIEGEVIHASKFSPSKLYGISPVFTLWVVARTSYLMDRYNQDLYEKGRPKGILAVTGMNMTNFRKWWDKEQAEMRKDPHYLPSIVAETEEGAARIEFVRLIESLKEMQADATKDAMQKIMCALYGVSMVFMADTSSSGGLNNEGLQITVTDRAVDASQAVYHSKIFPKILELIGITDWKLKLKPSREADQMAELQREGQRISNAKELLNMGFDVALKDDMSGELDFVFSGEASRQEYQPFGFGGQNSYHQPQLPSGSDEGNGNEAPEPDNRLGEKNCPPGMIATPDNPKCHPIDWKGKDKEKGMRSMHYKQLFEKFKKIYQSYLKKFGENHPQTIEARQKMESYKLRYEQSLAQEATGQHTFFLPMPKSQEPIQPMTYDECILKMNTRGDVKDPMSLCDWMKQNLPGIIKESKRELQQETQQIESAFLRGLHELMSKELTAELSKLNDADEDSLKKKVEEIISSFKPHMEKGAFAEVIMAYKQGKTQAKESLEKANMPAHINISAFPLSRPDEQVLRAIYEQNPFWSSFAGMSQSISDKLKENITESFKDPSQYSIGKLIKLMKQTINAEVYRLERIARSETTAITAKGREIAFEEADPESKNRYTWAGPMDDRTSDQCKEIQRRVDYVGQGKGVTLKQLKAIMQDVVDEFNATQKSNWQYRDWLPHGNCRRRLQWVGRME